MRLRSWVLIGVAGAACVAIAIAVALWLRSDTLEESVVFPAVWTPAIPADDVPWTHAEIQLLADGSAILNDVPGGDVQSSGDALCVDRAPGLFSGEGSWRMEGDRAVRVEYAEGALIMYAANGKFGSFDWLSVGIPFCGDEQPAYFGLRTEHRY